MIKKSIEFVFCLVVCAASNECEIIWKAPLRYFTPCFGGVIFDLSFDTKIYGDSLLFEKGYFDIENSQLVGFNKDAQFKERCFRGECKNILNPDTVFLSHSGSIHNLLFQRIWLGDSSGALSGRGEVDGSFLKLKSLGFNYDKLWYRKSSVRGYDYVLCSGHCLFYHCEKREYRVDRIKKLCIEYLDYQSLVSENPYRE